MNKIGNTIRKLREAKGYSQEYVAIELGLTQPTYAKIEKEGDKISVGRLIKIAKILNCTISDLFGEEVMQHFKMSNFKDSKYYLDNVSKSDKEHIETLRNEIDFLRKLFEKFKNS